MVLLNRSTTIKLFCCKFGSLKFKRGEGSKLDKFEKFLRFGIIACFFLEVGFTLIDLLLSSESRENTRQNSTKI